MDLTVIMNDSLANLLCTIDNKITNRGLSFNTKAYFRLGYKVLSSIYHLKFSTKLTKRWCTDATYLVTVFMAKGNVFLGVHCL